MKDNNKTTDILVLLVFAVFALCLLLVLLTGAKVYRNLTERAEASFEMRTAAQYVTMRIRQAEAVEVAEFDGCMALVLPEQIGGERYVTRVYCHAGYIRELYSEEDADLTKDAGEKIIPAEQLEFSISGQLLTVRLDDRELCLDLAGKEAAP